MSLRNEKESVVELKERLCELDILSSQLEPTASSRLELAQVVFQSADKFIEAIKTSPGYSDKLPHGLAIDDKKSSIGALLALYRTEVSQTGINCASGTHLGYIPGGGLFVSALADFLAAVTNPFAGNFYASPGAATVELEVLSWLKSVFSFPESSVGNLTSGGSISTLIALTAARDHHGVKNERVTKAVVYLSEQVHHSTQKALRIIGLGDVVMRKVALDEHHRMQVSALKASIEADLAQGLQPFLIVATSGTTDTGAVDPLAEIAAIAKLHKLWFHVDAAYGGFFILTSRKELFRGIEEADSLVCDPHKGLFIPYGLGAVLVKNKEAVLHSNNYTASYMQDAVVEELVQNPANVSPELSKHFRGLRLWLPLRFHGIEPFRACLEEKLVLTKYFRLRLKELGFKLGPEPDLSVSYFWYPFEADEEAKNRQLMDEIHADGDVFLSSSIVAGRFVIRMAILSFRTKMSTIDRAVAMIERCLRQIEEAF